MQAAEQTIERNTQIFAIKCDHMEFLNSKQLLFFLIWNNFHLCDRICFFKLLWLSLWVDAVVNVKELLIIVLNKFSTAITFLQMISPNICHSQWIKQYVCSSTAGHKFSNCKTNTHVYNYYSTGLDYSHVKFTYTEVYNFQRHL